MAAGEEPDLRRAFGHQLQRQRGLADLSQAELAAIAKCSPSYVALVETGKRRASDAFLRCIAEPLRLDTDVLIQQRHLADSLAQLRGVSPALKWELASFVSDRLESGRRSSGREDAKFASWPDFPSVRQPAARREVMTLALGVGAPKRGRKSRREKRLEELTEKATEMSESQLERLLGYLDGLTEKRGDASTSSGRSVRRPQLRPGQAITEYTRPELVALIRWIESDGRLRTKDDLKLEAMRALGFRRLGKRIDTALNRAIRAAHR